MEKLKDFRPIIAAANGRTLPDGTGVEIFPQNNSSEPSFTVKTIHISCKSDAWRGSNLNYGGIIIYGRDGQPSGSSDHWITANGTKCKPGYLVILDTDRMTKYGEPGIVHGDIYRNAFGESVRDHKVIGEGFAVLKGKFRTTSRSMNESNDDYHDDHEWMNPTMAKCVERVVDYWKSAGDGFLKCQNHSMKDLLKN